ncbi:MAG: PRC-barrel domain-containing protein [Gammaproteobacteria bacterium]|nr:PRC-barrel domain-containing protein [Gammaproteobacteria bacterium]
MKHALFFAVVGLIFAPTAIAGQHGGKVIVVDAPDLFKVPESVTGPRFSTLLGETVYSNKGKRIGEIEDFVLAKGGEMYAVIDTSKDPIADLLDLADDEIVIVPLRELRRSMMPK